MDILSLTKVNYVAEQTVITAENLNNMQDAIIANEQYINQGAQTLSFLSDDIDVINNTISNSHLATTAILGKTWSGSGPYTQTLTITGITENDCPHITPIYKSDSSDTDTIIERRIEQWQDITYAEATAGGIKFTCLSQPNWDYLLKVQIEVNR